jgi:hypothetical protein
MIESTEKLLQTRFDRNIAHNILDLDVFNETAPLIRSLVVYFAYQYNNTKDLFGFGKLDPVDFCLKMGFERSNLFRNIIEIGSEEDKKQLEDKGPRTNPALRVKKIPVKNVNGSEYKMDTLFEYALNQLLLNRIPLSFGGVTATGKEKIQLRAINILDGLDIEFLESRGGVKSPKRIYLYKPSDVFLQNLARVYVNMNVTALPILRKNGTDSLYFYLLSLRDIMIYKKEPATPNFDMLCKIAGVACAKPSDNKLRITKKILDIKDKAGLDIRLVWEKNGRHNFKPVIFFDNIKCKTKEEIIKEKDEVFHTVYIRKLQNLFESIYVPNASEGQILNFTEFIRNNQILRKEKATRYVEAFNLVYGQNVTIHDNAVVSKFGKFADD